MKHFRLLLLMMFLCLGTTMSWAKTAKYRVLYEKVFIQGAGYNKNTASGATWSGDTLKVTYNNTNPVSQNNLSSYLTPIDVDGYTEGLYLDTNDMGAGYDGTIYVNYNTTATDTPWVDDSGLFSCSKIYTPMTGTTVLLPVVGGVQQVAISLNMKKPTNVTDTVSLYGNNYYLYQDQNQTKYIGYVNRNNRITIDGSYSSDDDGVSYSNYKFEQIHSHGSGGGTYYFTRTHQINYSDETDITIPKVVKKDNVNYTVSAIQKFGFVYNETHKMDITDERQNCNVAFWPWNSHRNRYLQKITFELNSNVKSIGDYAFESCTALGASENDEIILPSSIEYLGKGAFQQCESLKKLSFQGNSSGVKILRNFTFWMCVSMTKLHLPDEIEEIEGMQSGSSLQYLLKLTDIRLPNDLKKVGPHFLCCAMSLESLTIPAKVEYIDGACFHGCEHLHEVYLLGRASALQKEYSTDGNEASTTFDKNVTFCAGKVQNCIFYTTPDYVNSYADHETWALIADNQVGGYLCEVDDEGNILKDENGQPVYVTVYNEETEKWEKVSVVKEGNDDNNRLVCIAEVKRTFEAGKWVTAIFSETFKHKFAGDENETTGYAVFSDTNKPVRVAKMTSATAGTGTDPQTGKAIRLYHLTFTLVNESEFEPDVPYMFCPGRTVEDYVMISKETYAKQSFKEKMTDDRLTRYSIEPGDGSKIWMLGHYKPWNLYDYCFYFSYAGNEAANAKANFYRVPQNATLTSDPTRCFWYVDVQGIPTRIGQAKVASQRFFEDEEDNNSTTGIEEMETRFVIDAIYDLNGRKLNVKPEELPKGLFIINGKKVMINK